MPDTRKVSFVTLRVYTISLDIHSFYHVLRHIWVVTSKLEEYSALNALVSKCWNGASCFTKLTFHVGSVFSRALPDKMAFTWVSKKSTSFIPSCTQLRIWAKTPSFQTLTFKLYYENCQAQVRSPKSQSLFFKVKISQL